MRKEESPLFSCTRRTRIRIAAIILASHCIISLLNKTAFTTLSWTKESSQALASTVANEWPFNKSTSLAIKAL